MKFRLAVAFLSAASLLTGCSVPSTGVLPSNDNMFTVTRQGGSFLTSVLEVKTAAIKEASDYCTGLGKKYRFIHSKEIPAGAYQFPESEVLFRCE